MQPYPVSISIEKSALVTFENSLFPDMKKREIYNVVNANGKDDEEDADSCRADHH